MAGEVKREKVTVKDSILMFFKVRKHVVTGQHFSLNYLAPFFFWKREQMLKKCRENRCSATLLNKAEENYKN